MHYLCYVKRLIILIFSFSTIGYSQQDFGPPSNPTYGFVQPDIPQDYYAEAINLAGDDLKEALHQIIQTTSLTLTLHLQLTHGIFYKILTRP